MVYVIAKDNSPLMPCENVIARLLLKSGKAKVKRREPFTIKLTIDSTHYVQELTLGVDTGSSVIGTAVSTNDGKIVYASEVKVRNDIKEKMDRRRRYRRNRRQRKTRFRKARFKNRKNSKKVNRFSPTMVSKIHSHKKEINFIKSILPIKNVVLETGTFDMHLMKNAALANPKIKHWGYQRGANYGFENTKAKVLDRDNYTCQHCYTKKNIRLEVHHIIYRSNGGSDEENNLITLCTDCHRKVHQGKVKLKLDGKKKGKLKHATQMNSIRVQLFKEHPEYIETFGSITKANRQLLGIEKTHYYDASVIASGGKPIEIKTKLYRKVCISEGDMQQTKGIRSEQKIPTGKIRGFKKFDKVRFNGKIGFIKGRMSSGYAILMDISGKKLTFDGCKNKIPKFNNMKRLKARTSWIIDTVAI